VKNRVPARQSLASSLKKDMSARGGGHVHVTFADLEVSKVLCLLSKNMTSEEARGFND
jgi:hypothetical protein